jgi:hypothetical protein
LSHHHTLGIGGTQASPGNHTHDGKNSKRIGGATTTPTVVGSRGGNVALANLLTALASQGLIIDGTTV